MIFIIVYSSCWLNKLSLISTITNFLCNMSDKEVTSSHGIVVANGLLNFDGTYASLYPLLMRCIQRSFNESIVPLPKSTDTEASILH